MEPSTAILKKDKRKLDIENFIWYPLSMSYRSDIRPQIFTRFFSIRFRPETVEKLTTEAVKRGYVAKESKRINITRVCREIIEDYFNA